MGLKALVFRAFGVYRLCGALRRFPAVIGTDHWIF
jgi:hypothetical protein